MTRFGLLEFGYTDWLYICHEGTPPDRLDGDLDLDSEIEAPANSVRSYCVGQQIDMITVYETEDVTRTVFEIAEPDTAKMFSARFRIYNS